MTVLGGLQPWSEIIFPAAGASVPWATAQQAKAIPGVGRALSLICGQISTMPLNAVRGRDVLDPRPRLLEAPDPDNSLPWFLYQQVEDWWLHGNAVQLVTARSRGGWPAAVMPLQAERVNITITPAREGRPREVTYWYDGVSLPTQDIIHVKRSVDPFMPERGVGVLEQHVLTLARARDQEEAERSNMAASGVPSVVIFTPGPVPTSEQMKDAKARWMDTHSGPGREPAFLPAGSEVKPLAWSPTDAQMVEARQLTLTDLSNIANLDPYWLGGSQGSLTYQSPGPLFLGLLRQTLEPILSALEAVWTRHWLPRGLLVKADRQAILGDDMGTTIDWLQTADSFGLLTKDEQRAYIGKSPLPPEPAAPVDGLEVGAGESPLDVAARVKAQGDAFGVLARSGATFTSAAEAVGLQGLEFVKGHPASIVLDSDSSQPPNASADNNEGMGNE